MEQSWMGPQLSFEWIIENYLEHRTICKDLFITSLVHSWLIISHPNEKIKAAFAVSHYRINRMNHLFRSLKTKDKTEWCQLSVLCPACAGHQTGTRRLMDEDTGHCTGPDSHRIF